MKATVNANCIGCGLCTGTCPVVFSMGDDGLAHGGEIPANQLAEAETARDGLPGQRHQHRGLMAAGTKKRPLIQTFCIRGALADGRSAAGGTGLSQTLAQVCIRLAI